MDKIVKSNFRFLLVLSTGTIIGFIAGVVGFTMLIGPRIDQYIKNIKELETTIEDKDARLEKLEKSINNRSIVLKDVDVNLIYNGDDIDKITITKNIKDKFKILLGREIKDIDIEMVSEIIDNRIFKIGTKEYKLKINRILLSEVMKIWVEVDIAN